MKPWTHTSTFGRWRTTRLVATAIAMLCLVAAEIGLAQQEQAQSAQAPTAVPASRQADKVVVLPIRTPIDRFTMRGLEQRMQRAEQDGAQAVVIELDTPGGEVGAVLEISNLIKTSQVPIVAAWVNNEALSGGAIIAMACDMIVTNDPATLGDAIPIQVSQLFGIQQMAEDQKQKILAPLLVDLVDSARRNGYDEKLVQGFVSLGVELWMIERTRPGPEGQPIGERLFIDLAEYRLLFGEPPAARTPQIPSAGTGTAPPRVESATPAQPADPEDPLAFRPAAPELAALEENPGTQVSPNLAVPTQRPTLSEGDRGGWKVVAYATDGKAPVTMTSEQLVGYGVATTVVRSDAELKAFFGATTVVRWEESVWMAVARFMSNPVIRGLLLVAVLVGFFVEMASPGLGVPGAIGLLALIGLLTPAAMVGMAGWWEFAALGLGVVLVLVEIFVVPGLGIPGVVGAVLLFLGLLGTFTGGGGFQTQQELLTGVVVLLLSLASAGVVIFLIAKNLGRIPGLNRLILQSVPSDDDEAPSFFEAMSPGTTKLPISVGAVGAAVGMLRPSGRARFGEELYDVVSVGPIITDGRPIRVVEASAFRVVVEPVEESTDAGEARADASEAPEDSEEKA